MTTDEENTQWALNKFFYTTQKQSLMTAHTMMLKERHCDNTGILLEAHPSFHQFRYFFRRTRGMRNFHISRNGLTYYQRNERSLVGGVREFAPAVGTGMLDTTVCDIYLANDSGRTRSHRCSARRKMCLHRHKHGRKMCLHRHKHADKCAQNKTREK